jgi:hypothetical protein
MAGGMASEDPNIGIAATSNATGTTTTMAIALIESRHGRHFRGARQQVAEKALSR